MTPNPHVPSPVPHQPHNHRFPRRGAWGEQEERTRLGPSRLIIASPGTGPGVSTRATGRPRADLPWFSPLTGHGVEPAVPDLIGLGRIVEQIAGEGHAIAVGGHPNEVDGFVAPSRRGRRASLVLRSRAASPLRGVVFARRHRLGGAGSDGALPSTTRITGLPVISLLCLRPSNRCRIACLSESAPGPCRTSPGRCTTASPPAERPAPAQPGCSGCT